MKKTTLISVSLLALAANFAVASDQEEHHLARDGHHWDRDQHYCHGDNSSCVSAPEIDPAQAMSALALLGGTIAIVRGYRRKKK
jgi:hypothetical protein